MLKLVAGEVQRIGGNELRQMHDEMKRMAAAEAAAPQFSQERFFEYHLYTLGRPTTLRENEPKQVTLLESAGIGDEKKLIVYRAQHYYRSQYGEVVSNQKVGVFLEPIRMGEAFDVLGDRRRLEFRITPLPAPSMFHRTARPGSATASGYAAVEGGTAGVPDVRRPASPTPEKLPRRRAGHTLRA